MITLAETASYSFKSLRESFARFSKMFSIGFFWSRRSQKCEKCVGEEMKALSDGFAMIYSGAQLEVMPLFVLSLFTAAYLRD